MVKEWKISKKRKILLKNGWKCKVLLKNEKFVKKGKFC